MAHAQITKAGSFTLRHALVLASGIIFCLGPCALVYNSWAIFVVPVSSDLGVASSQFTFFITVIYLISALTAPFAGNLMEKIDLRIVTTVAVVCIAAGIFGCTMWTEIWQFYLSGLFEGIGVCTLNFVGVPTLINRWFESKTGFFVGLCYAMSGIGGALWSMVGGLIIQASSWREAYLVFAVIVLVIALPATLFFVRSYPHQSGLMPYGATEGEKWEPEDGNAADAKGKQWGVSAHTMFRSPAFYTLMLTMGIFNALTIVGNLFASYIYHLGDLGVGGITPESAIMLASGVAACLMIVSAGSKVMLGAVTDKSMVAAVVIACGCGFVGILCIWLGAATTALIYVGGCLGGVLYAAVDAMGAAMTRQLVGPRDYTVIYSRVAVFVNLAGAVSATAFAAVADISWDAEWIMALVLIAITLVLGLSTVKLGKNLKQTYE